MIEITLICVYLALIVVAFYVLYQLEEFNGRLTEALDRIEYKTKDMEIKLEKVTRTKKYASTKF